MKRLTLEMLLAGTLAVSPAAFAQDLPSSDPATSPDHRTAPNTAPSSGSTTGTVPVPSQRRERNTTPTPATPDDPEHNGRTGYPPGAQSAPDTTNPYNPGPSDGTRPYSGSRPRTNTEDTNLPAGKGTVGGTTTSGNTGATDTTGTRPGSTAADSPPANAVTPTAGAEGDVETVAKVHEANQKEIEMAQMALDKAESPRVKAYARKLLADHQAADKKLMAYAERKSLDVSKAGPKTTAAAPAPSDDEAHKRLQTATGADFDRDFVNVMVSEHEKAIDLVKSARDSVTDKSLRTVLSGMLPKLEQHLKMAKDLADKQSKS
jgi:putative membrane protein